MLWTQGFHINESFITYLVLRIRDSWVPDYSLTFLISCHWPEAIVSLIKKLCNHEGISSNQILTQLNRHWLHLMVSWILLLLFLFEYYNLE